MEHLTLKDLVNFTSRCIKDNIPLESPVFIGNDYELNDIHTAGYIQTINKKDKGDASLFKLIEDDRCNIKAEDINILIS